MHKKLAGGLVAAGILAGVTLAVAPATQAATVQGAVPHAATVRLATAPTGHVTAVVGARHASTVAPHLINCVNAYLGTNGTPPQDFFHVQCSATGTTQWYPYVSCSDGFSYLNGPYTTFLETWTYCPPGTAAVGGGVLYTP